MVRAHFTLVQNAFVIKQGEMRGFNGRIVGAGTHLPARAIPADLGATDEDAAAQGESSGREGTPTRGDGARRRPPQNPEDRLLRSRPVWLCCPSPATDPTRQAARR